MPNPIFITACLLAICLPILSVQLPRTALYRRLRSKYLEPRSTRWAEIADTITTTTTGDTAPPPSSPPHQSQHRQHKDSSPPSTEFIRRRSATPRKQNKPAQSLDGTHSGATSAEEEGGDVSAGRKPWDPPFPRRESVKVGSWRILPPVPMRENESVVKEPEEEKRVAVVDGEDEEEEGFSQRQSIQENEGEEERRDRANRRENAKGMLFVWVGAAIMAALLFLVVFAVLTAHCLAWFLVYKTEARLGEARRGIMTSGDMRLCLCAT